MSRGHNDFDGGEPIRGLPERLPEGERILWQGAPEWKSLALSAYYAGAVAVYFALLMTWRGVAAYADNGDLPAAIAAGLTHLPLAAIGVGLLCFIAWLAGRTTVYTITNRRVVMRIGIALPKAINIPFKSIAAAALRKRIGGAGDIPLQLRGPDRIGYAHLWPHVRPWRLALPEPMLRSIPDAEAVAGILARALREASGDTSRVAAPENAVHENAASAARTDAMATSAAA
jgi:hypothetical protein